MVGGRLDLKLATCLDHVAEHVHPRAETRRDAVAALRVRLGATGLRDSRKRRPCVGGSQRSRTIERGAEQIDDAFTKVIDSCSAADIEWQDGDRGGRNR